LGGDSGDSIDDTTGKTGDTIDNSISNPSHQSRNHGDRDRFRNIGHVNHHQWGGDDDDPRCTSNPKLWNLRPCHEPTCSSAPDPLTGLRCIEVGKGKRKGHASNVHTCHTMTTPEGKES
jgi:hypothetical protein